MPSIPKEWSALADIFARKMNSVIRSIKYRRFNTKRIEI
jgi:hypothetical protein